MDGSLWLLLMSVKCSTRCSVGEGLDAELVAQAEAVKKQLVIESEILYAGDDTENDNDSEDLENECGEEES